MGRILAAAIWVATALTGPQAAAQGSPSPADRATATIPQWMRATDHRVPRGGFGCFVENVTRYMRLGDRIIVNLRTCPEPPTFRDRMEADRLARGELHAAATGAAGPDAGVFLSSRLDRGAGLGPRPAAGDPVADAPPFALEDAPTPMVDPAGPAARSGHASSSGPAASAGPTPDARVEGGLVRASPRPVPRPPPARRPRSLALDLGPTGVQRVAEDMGGGAPAPTELPFKTMLPKPFVQPSPGDPVHVIELDPWTANCLVEQAARVMDTAEGDYVRILPDICLR